MTKLDEIVKIEELKWREKTYDELSQRVDEVICYFTEYENEKFQFEIHKKENSSKNEIVIMVEGSKDSFPGNFFGKARYFVKTKDNMTRDIEEDEAF